LCYFFSLYETLSNALALGFRFRGDERFPELWFLILEEEGGVLGLVSVSFFADSGWTEDTGISIVVPLDVCRESCVVDITSAGSAGIIVSSEGASTPDSSDMGGKEPLITALSLETNGSSIWVTVSLDIGALAIEFILRVPPPFAFSTLVAPDGSTMLGADFVAAFRLTGFGKTRASPASCRRRNSRKAAAS
jgi:hypothetical protein